jgi:hypothetical protein
MATRSFDYMATRSFDYMATRFTTQALDYMALNDIMRRENKC